MSGLIPGTLFQGIGSLKHKPPGGLWRCKAGFPRVQALEDIGGLNPMPDRVGGGHRWDGAMGKDRLRTAIQQVAHGPGQFERLERFSGIERQAGGKTGARQPPHCDRWSRSP